MTPVISGQGSGGGSLTVKNGAQLALGSTQAISSGTAASITWTSATFDTGSYTNIAGHPTRLTVTTAGFYYVYAFIEFAANSTGVRQAYIMKNGSQPPNYGPAGQANGGAGATVPLCCPVLLQCAANDFFEVQVFQNSGGNLNVDTDSFFSITYMGS